VPHNFEFTHLFLFAMWLGFGVAAVALFFSRGLAGNFLRSGGTALRVVLIIVLLPVLIVLGGFSFLYTMIADSRDRTRDLRASMR
jgi:hypothetical protein